MGEQPTDPMGDDWWYEHRVRVTPEYDAGCFIDLTTDWLPSRSTAVAVAEWARDKGVGSVQVETRRYHATTTNAEVPE